MKQRGDECLSATCRCDVQLTVAMKEHLDAIAHALQSCDVRRQADARVARTTSLELAMKARVASVGTHNEGLALGSIWCAHSRVDVRCCRSLVEEPRIEPVAADNQAEAFREVGIRRCAAGDEAQAANARRIRQSSDRVQRRDAVREQSFTAGFESWMAGLLVEIDAHAAAAQLNRECSARRAATGDRDVSYHTIASISAANPGPSASISPLSPDFGTPLATRLLNITSTAALDRLPN